MPDQEQAKRDIANHILRSWDPRMRRTLLSHVATAGDGKLKPMVRDALPMIRDS
ncbi:MAG: formate dehydrogenase subunit delta [Candidatus Thiodiazotropha sp.]